MRLISLTILFFLIQLGISASDKEIKGYWVVKCKGDVDKAKLLKNGHKGSDLKLHENACVYLDEDYWRSYLSKFEPVSKKDKVFYMVKGEFPPGAYVLKVDAVATEPICTGCDSACYHEKGKKKLKENFNKKIESTKETLLFDLNSLSVIPSDWALINLSLTTDLLGPKGKTIKNDNFTYKRFGWCD